MMDEREPKWYEQARKGPFQEEKFTASSAEQVMRRLHAEAEPSRPRTRQRLRLGIMTAVIFLVLAGGGALYLNNGPQDGVNTAGVTVPAEEQTELSDDALKRSQSSSSGSSLAGTFHLKSWSMCRIQKMYSWSIESTVRLTLWSVLTQRQEKQSIIL